MQPKNLLDVKNRHELREWLKNNHDREPECWVIVRKGKPLDDSSFWYLDAVEEALCFGWIDSVHRTIEGYGHGQKLSPRKANSPWSELNKERCKRLEKLGLMTEAGRMVMPDLNEKFVVDKDIAEILQSDAVITENLRKFPSLYNRIRIANIQRERNKPEVFDRMLRNFLDKTRKGIMYGEWNDYGRLIDY